MRLRSRLRVNGHPIDTPAIPLQDPVLNHVPSNGCGVGVEGCDYFIESFFGVAHIGGQPLGDAMENGNLLGGIHGPGLCDYRTLARFEYGTVSCTTHERPP